MKKWLTIAGILAFIFARAQNEFAATAFYNEFNKIYSDAQNGFLTNKGRIKEAAFPELATEYAVKLLLPLADSGKIVYPLSGMPYVIYFFEPAKSRLKIDQRGLNLREAIVIAFGKPLFTRTEAFLQNDRLFSSTFYYLNAGDDNKKTAIFKSSIYQQDGLYYLAFEIRGKAP